MVSGRDPLYPLQRCEVKGRDESPLSKAAEYCECQVSSFLGSWIN